VAVVVREEREIGGKMYSGVKVYLSDRRFVTKTERDAADKLDKYLEEELRDIREEADSRSLIGLKGKPGVLQLWHFVGSRLGFVDDPAVIPPEDRKYIWRALWDHAGELAPGEKDRQSRKEGSFRDHFRYCYFVGRYPWEEVGKAGNWRAWVEFLDSPWTRNDERIPRWIGNKVKVSAKRNWLRGLNRRIRQELRSVHTRVLTDEELEERLERIWDGVMREAPA
jgi:hypothetical protein